ncbi:MAG: hypothetical protein FH748_05360 [Balneolaceae bacterium]|nr:hypothetical protein [Balneolaceae bacterium]
MKKLYNLILIGLVSLLLTPSLIAQEYDSNRMNRDIKIMEEVLSELFKVQNSSYTRKGNFIMHPDFGGNHVEGTYLPDYGIIFKIPRILSRYISSISVDKSNGKNEIHFYYDSDDSSSSRQVTEEAIIARIAEFLKDYASTIGQLDDDENILVIYGSKPGSSSILSVYDKVGNLVDKDDVKPLPVISVVAQKKDLRAFRSGTIDDAAFEDRLTISKSQDNKKYVDLKVMSNIFETALKEVPREAFRISGHVNYLMLDNFGALFSVDVRYNDRKFNVETFFIREAERRARALTTADKKENDDNRTPSKEEMQEKMHEAYQQLKTDVTEYLIDYGRTLGSVQSDQHILTSVNISDTWINANLPERVDFQIKKSILDQMDRGSISRQQALNSVTVTEY